MIRNLNRQCGQLRHVISFHTNHSFKSSWRPRIDHMSKYKESVLSDLSGVKPSSGRRVVIGPWVRLPSRRQKSYTERLTKTTSGKGGHPSPSSHISSFTSSIYTTGRSPYLVKTSVRVPPLESVFPRGVVSLSPFPSRRIDGPRSR